MAEYVLKKLYYLTLLLLFQLRPAHSVFSMGTFLMVVKENHCLIFENVVTIPPQINP